MAKTYLEIQAQIAKLQSEADALKAREMADVVKRIKEAIAHYGLTATDLGFKATRGPVRAERAGRKATAKSGKQYGDGQGNTWGGRGPRPAWLREALAQGRALEEFALGATSKLAQDTVGAKKPAAGKGTTGKQGATAKASASRAKKAARTRRTAKESGGSAAQAAPASGSEPAAE